MDGTNLSGLQTDPAAADTRDVLPTDQANLTGTQQDGQEHRESDEEVESSNANHDGDQHERVPMERLMCPQHCPKRTC